MNEDEYYNTLTPSQKKILIEQEMWMKDVGAKYSKSRTRIDAMYDIQQRFPTESIARKVVESGGDPAVVYLYLHDQVKKIKRNKRKTKSVIKRRK